MAIRYYVVENPFQEGSYTPRVYAWGTITTSQIAERIVLETGLSRTDVYAVLNAISDHILRSLLEGYNVAIDGIGNFSLSLGEKLTSPEDEVSKAVRIRINLRPAGKLRQGLKRKATFERIVKAEHAPVITRMRDVASGQENRYTPGSIGEVMGLALRLNPDRADEGLFFIAADGVERRAEVYAQASRQRIVFLIPAGLSGEQRIEVRTRYNSARLRSGSYRHPLLPA